MSLGVRGRYTIKGKGQALAIARCDKSGIMGMYTDLKKQYIRAGEDLVWNGQWALPPFIDVPDGTFIPPFKLDPAPLDHVRPDPDIGAQTTIANSSGAIFIDVSGDTDRYLTENEFSNGQITFSGVLLGNIVVYVPNTYNQLYITNVTTGDYTLGMQIIENATDPLIIDRALPGTLGVQIVNNLFNLQIVYF